MLCQHILEHVRISRIFPRGGRFSQQSSKRSNFLCTCHHPVLPVLFLGQHPACRFLLHSFLRVLCVFWVVLSGQTERCECGKCTGCSSLKEDHVWVGHCTRLPHSAGAGGASCQGRTCAPKWGNRRRGKSLHTGKFEFKNLNYKWIIIWNEEQN